MARQMTFTGREAQVVLVDYVQTLVANCHERTDHWRPGMDYRVWIGREQYREWLVELLRGHQKVVLVTARSQKYQDDTLRRIWRELHWEPYRWYFNERNLRPPESKRLALERCIYPEFGGPAETGYLALESNASTRAMYRREGITAIRVPEDEPWRRLPTV